MKMFDAAVDFACHNNGDRIARELTINYGLLVLSRDAKEIEKLVFFLFLLVLEIGDVDKI